VKSKYWRCPQCGAILKKGLGTLPPTVIGIGTCNNCGAQFQQSEICTGRFDVFLEFDVRSGKVTRISDGPVSDPRHEELLLACRAGSGDAVKKLLSQGVPPDGIDPNWTPLMMAASNGHEQIVSLLLHAGAEPNVAGEFGAALVLAARYKHISVVRGLLDGGADIQQPDHGGTTTLSYVVACGDEELTEELLRRGADVNHKNQGGGTALYIAAAEGHARIVEILLSAGAAVDMPPTSYSHETPLSIAKKNGHVQIARLLSSKF
jgi:ankyrin repeat protein